MTFFNQTFTTPSKSNLRKQLRKERRSLSELEQLNASLKLVETVKVLLSKNRVSSIAMYLAMDGEIDLQPLMMYCEQHHIEVYLPVIHPFHPRVWFAKYEADDALFNNHFGIPEPINGRPIAPWQLSWVLCPLVGFDLSGGRLGMGGGFYDRTFARASQWLRKPKLFGVAHECQKVDSLPLDSWDIPLDGILTDEDFYLGHPLKNRGALA